MAGPESDGHETDPGIRLILEEIRDLRLEMRADRQHADEERRRADEERRLADEDRRRANEEWRQERQQSDERFQQLVHEFREDSARREAVTQKAFNDLRAVGLSIVKTLNHHTRILQRIERNSARGNWRRGHGDGHGG